MESEDPRGYDILQKHFELICKSNLDPSSLAGNLFGKALISDEVRQEVGAITTKRKKLEKILEGVMANGAPGVFQEFVAIVRRDKAHRWLADKLEGRKVTR